MITGTITDLRPHLNLLIKGASVQALAEFTIDTGYSGALTLPLAEFLSLGLTRTGDCAAPPPSRQAHQGAPAVYRSDRRRLGNHCLDDCPSSECQADGEARALANSQVELKFVKRGFSGIQVESKRGAETNWSVLGNYLRSPILDTRPLLVAGQPETRSYRYRYLSGNDPVGTVSDTFTVTTIP